MIPTYDDALRTILELPTLESESWGARRVVQCLFKPSFHPECAISLVERNGVSALTVRVPSCSIWSVVSARRGVPTNDPAADWVKPTLSTEHVAGLPPEAAAAWQAAVDAIAGARLPERATIGLDGMTVDVRLWSPSLRGAFSLWFGELDPADSRHRLVGAVLGTALRAARWERSAVALANVRGYLGEAFHQG